ncbi:MAG: hypothetical protein ACJ741_10880, partial [Pyrinomonadaceae bacterium]
RRREMRVSEHNSTRGGGRVRRICVAAVLLSLSGASCAQDPQKEIRQEAQTLASWAATLHLLGDDWHEGSVPSRYVAKSAEEAHETLQEEAQKLERSCRMCYGSLSQLLGARAENLGSLASSLSQAVRNEDRAAVEQLSARLSEEQRAFDDLARGAGAK